VRGAAVIGVLLQACLVVSGAAGTPGEAAVSFLGEVRGAGESIEGVMKAGLLSPYCGETKREWIANRLQQLRKELREGEVELKEIGTREDGEYAAVLVSATPERDPFQVVVYGVGLRREGEQWKAAPVLGSFVNTNVGYDKEVRERVSGLETWMGEQRVLRVRDLYQEAVADLEKRMKTAVPEEKLEGGSAVEVVRGFLDVCRKRDLAAVLVYLGADSGRADEPTSPQSIVSRGLGGDEALVEWQLLTSPDVVSVVAEEQKARSETLVSVLFYDTDSVSGAKLLKFSVSKDSGRWEVDLPRVLREAYTERRPWREPDEREHELRRRFSAFFEAAHPAERIEDAKAMGVRIDAVLREGTLAEFFALLCRNERAAQGERLVTYAEAAQLWQEFRERGRDATHGDLVDVIVEGTAAAVVLHLVTTAELDRMELVTLLLVREKKGWAIAPGVTSLGNWETMPRQESLDQKEVLMKFIRQKLVLEKRAAENFLSGFAEVDEEIKEEVSKEEAGRLVQEFRAHLRAGDLAGAFANCALLDRSEGAWEGLKSMTYEYRGTRKAGEPDRELLIQREGAWAGVSLRLDSGPGDVPDYPLYLVRSTAKGPRIVVDAGLRLATNKGREILNDRNLKHMEVHLKEGELGLVRALFAVHRGESKTDYEAWEKSIKSSP